MLLVINTPIFDFILLVAVVVLEYKIKTNDRKKLCISPQFNVDEVQTKTPQLKKIFFILIFMKTVTVNY